MRVRFEEELGPSYTWIQGTVLPSHGMGMLRMAQGAAREQPWSNHGAAPRDHPGDPKAMRPHVVDDR